MLYLGFHSPSPRLEGEFKPRPYQGRTDGLITGLFAYAVSPEGARLLLKRTAKLREQVDSQISNSIPWETVNASQRCFVSETGSALVLAPESGESDVQSYAGQGGFRPHPTSFRKSFCSLLFPCFLLERFQSGRQ